MKACKKQGEVSGKLNTFWRRWRICSETWSFNSPGLVVGRRRELFFMRQNISFNDAGHLLHGSKLCKELRARLVGKPMRHVLGFRIRVAQMCVIA